jgi:hypothetical protein
MRTFYCQSESPFFELLRPMFNELDSLYWIVDCQTGPVKQDWIEENPDHERIFDEIHIPVGEFCGSRTALWRPGSFKKIGHVLWFDEWSYFTGFQSSEAEALERAVRLEKFCDYSSPDFRDVFMREGCLQAVHVDGWWELYPATDDLCTRIQSCSPFREIKPWAETDGPERIPQFLD